MSAYQLTGFFECALSTLCLTLILCSMEGDDDDDCLTLILCSMEGDDDDDCLTLILCSLEGDDDDDCLIIILCSMEGDDDDDDDERPLPSHSGHPMPGHHHKVPYTLF